MSSVYTSGEVGSPTGAAAAGDNAAAARLKDVKELYEKLGSSVYQFQGLLEKSAGALIFYGKAMGIGNEGAAEMLKVAQGIGKDGLKYVKGFADQAAKSLEAYGVSAKFMARGMTELLKTLPHLQRDGAAAFAPIVAYAQKMGLELKQVTGILDTFSSADKSLEVASNLAQIGVSLDPLVLVAEKNPAKQLDMIGKAMHNAGKAVDLSDRHMRSYLKSTLSIDDATLDRIASENGLANSFNKTAKQADGAAKKQKTQQEVMEELGKGIRQLITTMDLSNKGITGFFSALTAGFSDGVMGFGIMRGSLISIRDTLKMVYKAGKDLAKMFMESFPGVREMLEGVVKLFDKAATREFLKVIKSAFKELTNIVGSLDPKEGIKSFFEKLFNGFNSYSGKIGTFWSNIMPGLKTFTDAAGKIVGGLISFIGDKIASGITSLADIIKNGFGGGGGGGMMSDIGVILRNIFSPIWEGLKDAGGKIWDAMGVLWTDGIWPKLQEWGKNLLKWGSEAWTSLTNWFKDTKSSGEGSFWAGLKIQFEEAWVGLKDWWQNTAWPQLESWWNELVEKWKPVIKSSLIGLRNFIVSNLGDGFLANKIGEALMPKPEDALGKDSKWAKEYNERSAGYGYTNSTEFNNKLLAEITERKRVEDDAMRKADQKQEDAIALGYEKMSIFLEKNEQKIAESKIEASKNSSEAIKKAADLESKERIRISQMTITELAKFSKAKDQTEKEIMVREKTTKLRSLTDLVKEIKSVDLEIDKSMLAISSLTKGEAFDKKLKKLIEGITTVFNSLTTKLNELKPESFTIKTDLVSGIVGFSALLSKMSESLISVKGFSMGPKTFDSIHASVKRYSDIISTLNNMSTESILQRGNDILDFANKIVTANNTLHKDSTAASVLEAIPQAFKSGKVAVTHNLPNTSLNISITRDTAVLASQLIQVDLGTDKTSQYIATGESKTNLKEIRPPLGGTLGKK